MVQVTVRFHANDVTLMRARAQEKNLSLSDYVRKQVLAETSLTAGEKILLAEIVRTQELLSALLDGSSSVVHVRERVDLLPVELLVQKALSNLNKSKRIGN